MDQRSKYRHCRKASDPHASFQGFREEHTPDILAVHRCLSVVIPKDAHSVNWVRYCDAMTDCLLVTSRLESCECFYLTVVFSSSTCSCVWNAQMVISRISTIETHVSGAYRDKHGYCICHHRVRIQWFWQFDLTHKWHLLLWSLISKLGYPCIPNCIIV